MNFNFREVSDMKSFKLGNLFAPPKFGGAPDIIIGQQLKNLLIRIVVIASKHYLIVALKN